MLKRIFLALCLSTLSLTSFASNNPHVLITTNKGTIELELDSTKAPLTVENFLNYIKNGFYSNTVFHRVIKGFMIQGGGFTEDLVKKDNLPEIPNEAFNGLKNTRGSIAMARTNMPHSATSQFFINTADNSFLNHSQKSMQGWGYAVFGKVIKGMAVVDIIENSRTGAKGVFSSDVPLDTVMIEKMEIIQK
jgi:cyclophilin family peptidyl-prolyl cis-trans isomerase